MKKKVIIYSVILIFIILFIGFIFLKNSKQEEDLFLRLYNMATPSSDASLLNELYLNENIITNNYALVIGISDYVKNKKVDSISLDNVDKSIKKCLGNFSYKPEDVYIFTSNYCGFDYNVTLKEFEVKGGCGGNMHESYYRKIISNYSDDEKVLIREKVLYIYNEWDQDESIFNIYDGPLKENLLDSLTEENFNNDKLKEYIDLANIYEYLFEKEENNYIFKGVSRVNQS